MPCTRMLCSMRLDTAKILLLFYSQVSNSWLPFEAWPQNIQGTRGQWQVIWWPGSFHHQVINSHSIGCVGWTLVCLLWGWISMITMTAPRSGVRWQYISTFISPKPCSMFYIIYNIDYIIILILTAIIHFLPDTTWQQSHLWGDPHHEMRMKTQ